MALHGRAVPSSRRNEGGWTDPLAARGRQRRAIAAVGVLAHAQLSLPASIAMRHCCRTALPTSTRHRVRPCPQRGPSPTAAVSSRPPSFRGGGRCQTRLRWCCRGVDSKARLSCLRRATSSRRHSRPSPPPALGQPAASFPNSCGKRDLSGNLDPYLTSEASGTDACSSAAIRDFTTRRHARPATWPRSPRCKARPKLFSPGSMSPPISHRRHIRRKRQLPALDRRVPACRTVCRGWGMAQRHTCSRWLAQISQTLLRRHATPMPSCRFRPLTRSPLICNSSLAAHGWAAPTEAANHLHQVWRADPSSRGRARRNMQHNRRHSDHGGAALPPSAAAPQAFAQCGRASAIPILPSKSSIPFANIGLALGSASSASAHGHALGEGRPGSRRPLPRVEGHSQIRMMLWQGDRPRHVFRQPSNNSNAHPRRPGRLVHCEHDIAASRAPSSTAPSPR